jgi:glycosyltransferase involved in cell wall biosynthesis
MTITTIITTHRRPLLAKRAVNSVLRQANHQFQVCVYDNSPDDETEKIMLELAKQDSRIKYHHHSKNIGMMANYKYAFAKIDTPYFSLLSDDDFLLPCFFETALEGFRQFPDTAFSACGVLQLTEGGNVIGDPLSLWTTEGYYSAPKGLLEMIKTRGRFPVPTGILFQNRFVKNEMPDFSQDIEFYWDPDYLLRIAARFPIVINKKHCGVYLAHPQSFSGEFYADFTKNVRKIEQFFVGTSTIMHRIKTSPYLSGYDRYKAKSLFNRYVKGEAASFSKNFILDCKYGAAHFLSKKYYRYFGISISIMFFHGIAAALKLSALLKKMAFRYIFRNKPLSIPINLKLVQECHDYGQFLFTAPPSGKVKTLSEFPIYPIPDFSCLNFKSELCQYPIFQHQERKRG